MICKVVSVRNNESENNLLNMLRKGEQNMEKKGKSNYIEVVFGNAFEFRGLSEDLVPTIRILEEKLMPIMSQGHEQQRELHILTLQAQGAVIASPAEDGMEAY